MIDEMSYCKRHFEVMFALRNAYTRFGFSHISRLCLFDREWMCTVPFEAMILFWLWMESSISEGVRQGVSGRRLGGLGLKNVMAVAMNDVRLVADPRCMQDVCNVIDHLDCKRCFRE